MAAYSKNVGYAGGGFNRVHMQRWDESGKQVRREKRLEEWGCFAARQFGKKGFYPDQFKAALGFLFSGWLSFNAVPWQAIRDRRPAQC